MNSVCVLSILVIHNSFEYNGSSKEIALKIGYHGSLAAAECNLANVSGISHQPNIANLN